MAENPADELKRNQALVVIGTSYRKSSGAGVSMIALNGRRFKADDVLEIQARGDEIMVPRGWFWQLFAPVSPETVGVQLNNAPVSHNPEGGEPTYHYYANVSPFVEQLFEAVVDAAHQHSEHNQLREQALQSLRDLQALGLIEIPVLMANQFRGRIHGFKWPYVVIAIDWNHVLRAGGMLSITAHHKDIEGFDVEHIESYLDRPVIFELGQLVEFERRAVAVRFVP